MLNLWDLRHSHTHCTVFRVTEDKCKPQSVSVPPVDLQEPHRSGGQAEVKHLSEVSPLELSGAWLFWSELLTIKAPDRSHALCSHVLHFPYSHIQIPCGLSSDSNTCFFFPLLTDRVITSSNTFEQFNVATDWISLGFRWKINTISHIVDMPRAMRWKIITSSIDNESSQ